MGGDAAPNLSAPATFHPLDSRVAASGAPLSSWLAQDLVMRDRWLLKHSRRGFSVSYPDSVAREINGSMLGPFDIDGTAGTTTAQWYLYATIANAETALAAPGVTEPRLLPPYRAAGWGLTLTGHGVPWLYGPVPAPHGPGPGRVLLALYPSIGVAASTEGGVVYEAQGGYVRVAAADLGSVAPGWAIRILAVGGASAYSEWSQVDEVIPDIAGVAYSEIWISPPLPRGVSWHDADKVWWEAKTADGAVTVHAAAWLEDPT